MPGFDLFMQGIGGVMHRGEEQPQVYRYFPPADMATGMLPVAETASPLTG